MRRLCRRVNSVTKPTKFIRNMFIFGAISIVLILISAAFSLPDLNDYAYNTVIENVNRKARTEWPSDLSRRKFKPDWSDLDTRPLPEWYDRAKIGIFLHWGVYSVPSFHSEWFWTYWNDPNASAHKEIDAFMKNNYRPGFTYQDFAPEFQAEFFDANEWADLFQQAGAKYVVLTSKHHEGYTLFPSKRSFSWNSVDVGPQRDLIGEIAKAARNKSLEFGVYHSLYEWYNPIYLEDRATNFTTYEYRNHKLWPDIKQLIEDYNPVVLWSDGDWEAESTYWNSTLLLAWLYNDSPVKDNIVVNDRWGRGTYGRHGDFYNYMDRYSPGVLQHHKWENAFTMDRKSWGFRRNMNVGDVLTMEELLWEIVTAVSCGGNALINVGPTKEGTIDPIFQERLLDLGKWLKVNGPAIYDTSPWTFQNDTLNGKVWYTCTKLRYNALQPTSKPTVSDTVTAIYATFLKWPEDGILKVKDLSSILHSGVYEAKILGTDTVLNWKIKKGCVAIELPERATMKTDYAWVLEVKPKQ